MKNTCHVDLITVMYNSLETYDDHHRATFSCAVVFIIHINCSADHPTLLFLTSTVDLITEMYISLALQDWSSQCIVNSTVVFSTVMYRSLHALESWSWHWTFHLQYSVDHRTVDFTCTVVTIIRNFRLLRLLLWYLHCTVYLHSSVDHLTVTFTYPVVFITALYQNSHALYRSLAL